MTLHDTHGKTFLRSFPFLEIRKVRNAFIITTSQVESTGFETFVDLNIGALSLETTREAKLIPTPTFKVNIISKLMSFPTRS